MRVEGGTVFISKRERQFPATEFVGSRVVIAHLDDEAFTPYERLLEQLSETGYANVSWVECSFYSPEVFSARAATIAMLAAQIGPRQCDLDQPERRDE
jgi:hypothetical protein